MSDLSLEIIGDFAIVWLLSPKKSFSAAPSGGVSLFASRLPGHALQVLLPSPDHRNFPTKHQHVDGQGAEVPCSCRSLSLYIWLCEHT